MCRERERERERQTDRQTDRHTDRQTDRDREREREGEREREENPLLLHPPARLTFIMCASRARSSSLTMLPTSSSFPARLFPPPPPPPFLFFRAMSVMEPDSVSVTEPSASWSLSPSYLEESAGPSTDRRRLPASLMLLASDFCPQVLRTCGMGTMVNCGMRTQCVVA